MKNSDEYRLGGISVEADDFVRQASPYEVAKVWQIALLLSQSSVVPEHLYDCPGDCFALLEIALRGENHITPLRLMQMSYVSETGDLMLEGEVVRAGRLQ